jgi:hypothetical protein
MSARVPVKNEEGVGDEEESNSLQFSGASGCNMFGRIVEN